MNANHIAVLSIIGTMLLLAVMSYTTRTSPTGMATLDTSLTIGNNAPVINVSNTTIYEFQEVNFSDDIYDPNGDPFNVTYSSPLDDYGYWQTGQGDAGIYLIEINATDGDMNSTKTVKLTVLEAACNLKAVLDIDQKGIDLSWTNYFEGEYYENFTIYYTMNFVNGSFDYDNAQNISTTQLSWTDSDANETYRRYYRVEGYNSTDSRFCDTTVGKLDINMTTEYNAWNYFSLPFTPENTSREAVLKTILGDFEWMYSYRTSDGNWDYWTYEDSNSLGTIDDMYPGQGYVVQPLINTTLTLVGTVFTNLTVNLTTDYNAWNYIGWVNEETDRETGLASIMGDFEWMYSYRTSDGNWDFWTYEDSNSLGTIYRLYPGNCYVIQPLDNITLTYEVEP